MCGAAAGFSAVFKAPLTGMLLALEIPYKKDIETDVFIPASIASVAAYFTSAMPLGPETIFMSNIFLVPTPLILLHAVLLGALAALVASAFIKIFRRMEDVGERLASDSRGWRVAALAGLTLGAMGLVYPEVLGLGYDFIHKITAASASNAQPWRVVVVKNRGVLEKFGSIAPGAAPIKGCSVAFAVIAKPEEAPARSSLTARFSLPTFVFPCTLTGSGCLD